MKFTRSWQDKDNKIQPCGCSKKIWELLQQNPTGLTKESLIKIQTFHHRRFSQNPYTNRTTPNRRDSSTCTKRTQDTRRIEHNNRQ